MNRRLIMGIVHAKYPPPAAGHQCSTLHWLLGFRELGWDVWIVEDMASSVCKNKNGEHCPVEESINISFWRDFVKQFGFEGRETLFVDGKGDARALREFAQGADLFLNYAGQFSLLDVVEDVHCKAYLDVDPGYTQTWAVAYGCDMNFKGHDRFVTIGSTIGCQDCKIPSTGHEWIPTLPPVTPSFYQRSHTGKTKTLNKSRPWTTITHWYGTSEVAYKDIVLKPKRESFLQIEDLPRLVPVPFVVASDVEPHWDDYARFCEQGWRFTPVKEVCHSLESYLQFIHESTGEIGVAKQGYVAAHTGWISDRSLSYLASGRPVVALDTGWSQIIGEAPGLRLYQNQDAAAHQIQEVMADYEASSHSALTLAQEVFSAEIILPKLLKRLGLE